MATFTVRYSDQSMIDNHMRPEEKNFSADTDAEISRAVIDWIKQLHGNPPKRFYLEDNSADFTSVLMEDIPGDPILMGEVSFELHD